MERTKQNLRRLARQNDFDAGAFFLVADILDMYLDRVQSGMYDSEPAHKQNPVSMEVSMEYWNSQDDAGQERGMDRNHLSSELTGPLAPRYKDSHILLGLLREWLGPLAHFTLEQLGLWSIKDMGRIIMKMVDQGWFPELYLGLDDFPDRLFAEVC